MRKKNCRVKTVLGKVSACKNFGVYFFGAICVYNFLSVYFVLCPKKMCVKIVLCKGFSVAKVFCKNVYVPLFRCAKTSLYKASVCKNFLLCVKTSVCKGAFRIKITPAKRHFFDIFSDILSGTRILSQPNIF